jgi:hypothetical protein
MHKILQLFPTIIGNLIKKKKEKGKNLRFITRQIQSDIIFLILRKFFKSLE